LQAAAGNVFTNENLQGDPLLKLIPVLDLKDGRVVHARRGERSAYRPVETPLCQGSNPVDLCRGLLRLHPFTTIYVADLDSIADTGTNEGAVAELHAVFPQVTFWVDAGLPAAAAQDWLHDHEGSLVLGSESQTGAQEVAALVTGEPDRVILSLDFRGDVFQGPEELLSQARLWPQRVIVMTLARVGAGEGPDYPRLTEIMDRAGDREVMAAGGVRGDVDLNRLRGMGANGVLLASALFDGRIGEDEITAFHERHT
jgi:phosphoribosylformimino-5-aminoimidazole carboxamide ribotide isomerase